MSISVSVKEAKFSRLIADYIILYFQEHGELLTNLKLQKLLYYAHGWYLALYDKPLLESRIEAWVHGPVVPAIYHDFKKYGYGPITENPDVPGLNPHITEHLDEIMEVYGSYSAFELEHLTHMSDPWINARGDLPVDEATNVFISDQSMMKFFKKKWQDNDAQENC